MVARKVSTKKWKGSSTVGTFGGFSFPNITFTLHCRGTHGLQELTTAKCEVTEDDGWAMTAVTARILQAKSPYRSPSGDGYTFFVFTSLGSATDQ